MSQEEKDIRVYRNNLRKIMFETVLTSIGAAFSISTITVFWNSVGMNQTAIGFVQMAFTIAICCLDIPMGYIADRFNRKVLNIIGDFGVAIVFVLYAFSNNVYTVLVSEILLGVFMAMTNGVDQCFIKSNCDKIDNTGNMFKIMNVKIHNARYISLFIVTILGGIIAKYSIKLSIGISFIPYSLGAIIALGIKDFTEKAEVNHKNPLKDMAITIKKIMKKKDTRVLLISYMIGKEITHSQIWVFTPLLILVGVPIEIVSIGWVLNRLMQIFGGKLSEKMINIKTSNKFAIPIIIELSWLLILFFNTNIITVWLFSVNGFVHGLIEGNLNTVVQESAKQSVQTSVMSIAATGARILYIPLVYVVNYFGNIKLQYALVAVFIIFLPMSIFSYIELKKLEK